MKNSVSVFGPVPGNFLSRMSCAWTDSGLLVNEMFWDKTPARRFELTIPIDMIRTTHRPRVRHGCLLLARASVAGLTLIRMSSPFPPGFASLWRFGASRQLLDYTYDIC